MAHKPQKKTAVEDSASRLGVKDILNRTLIDWRYAILAQGKVPTAREKVFVEELEQIFKELPETLFNLFCNLTDTPVEILHVFLLGVVKYMVGDFMRSLAPKQKPLVKARYQSFNIDGLNIASMQAEYLTRHFANFIGKDFRIVLQAAPFVLFDYMDNNQLELWGALCTLAPLIFQTRIEDMVKYQLHLIDHIRKFLYFLVRSTAQWVNKPKIHMLLHLMDSVLRFGPPPLYATEKFEGYNSILQNASIHSNRQSPGKDIGVIFGDYHNVRQLVSGGYFYDKKSGVYCRASPAVISIFLDNPSVQKSMGYNAETVDITSAGYPAVRKWKVPTGLKFGIPPELQAHLRGYILRQVNQISWNSKTVLAAGSFVTYNSGVDFKGTPHLGQISHLWEGRKGGRVVLYLCLSPFAFEGVDTFYNMRKVKRQLEGTFISIVNVRAKLNVQHNCHNGECPITLTRAVRLERQDTTNFSGEVAHSD
ncbi:hypothetical protein PTTG_29941 [Puccinia triticina 1-1 BBBD Race 1]|uniref:Uncharacterized protein n=1 Tax=Puccinia triticina (isolate 1-1 / race 1 (BBBD)) TaxID=630390 RepID=A0A180G1R6_PUCT1|nr:hypothetical protein PTTG_29941 [Puccinia triticina 1-1 BBBD Race 1]